MNNINLDVYDNMSNYISTIKKYKTLTYEEERELFELYSISNDLNAAKKIILHNLKFVFFYVNKHSKYGLPMSDLVQEGNVGLMEAVKKFKISKKVRFITYAVYYIRQNILDYVTKNVRKFNSVKSKNQRTLFYNLHKYQNNEKSLDDITITKISKDLKVPESTVRHMENVSKSQEVSINNPLGEEGHELSLPDNSLSPEHMLIENEKNEIKQLRIEKIKDGISKLDGRSRDILKSRYFTDKKQTFKSLSQKYGVSIERIRQIEKHAINILKCSNG